MTGQTAVCLFQGVVSMRICHSGTPQGGVLSPHLWNYYVSDFPKVAEQDNSYADDFTLCVSSSDIHELEHKLTDDFVHVSKWSKEKELTIEPEKSSVTLFTPDKHQSNVRPDMSYESVPIPLNPGPLYLGFNFNKHFAGTPQAENIVKKLNSQAKLLKAISGQDFGDKEVLLLTYKNFSKPTRTYSAPVYFPTKGLDHSSITRIQTEQNNSLRVVTGAHCNTPVGHIYAETKMLKVSESLFLSCRQFLANMFETGHPSNSVVRLPTGSGPGRKDGIVHTLQSRFKESIEPYLTDEVMLGINYKKSVKDMHTKTVEASKHALVNSVLGSPLPDIDPSESSLPRISQRTLCQLRCDKCVCLGNCKETIGTASHNLCPS
jgi:hypothetical protein